MSYAVDSLLLAVLNVILDVDDVESEIDWKKFLCMKICAAWNVFPYEIGSVSEISLSSLLLNRLLGIRNASW